MRCDAHACEIQWKRRQSATAARPRILTLELPAPIDERVLIIFGTQCNIKCLYGKKSNLRSDLEQSNDGACKIQFMSYTCSLTPFHLSFGAAS
jgi:hypothetical protein